MEHPNISSDSIARKQVKDSVKDKYDRSHTTYLATYDSAAQKHNALFPSGRVQRLAPGTQASPGTIDADTTRRSNDKTHLRQTKKALYATLTSSLLRLKHSQSPSIRIYDLAPKRLSSTSAKYVHRDGSIRACFTETTREEGTARHTI
jgi:hypothetical protein